MIIEFPSVLLFIEPENPGSDKPLLDDLTYKVLWAVRNSVANGHVSSGKKGTEFIEGLFTMGVHHCTGCRDRNIHSSSYDILLKGGLMTNTLAVHYMAYHRDEVPAFDLAKISLLEDPTGEMDPPTKVELGDYTKPKTEDDEDKRLYMTDLRTGEREYL